jgi:Predicted transcriptional regulator
MKAEAYNPISPKEHPNKLWRITTVLNVLPFSRATLYRHILKGDFPKPIKLTSHISAWDSAAVMDWVDCKRKGAC